MEKELQNKKVLILGFSKTGISAANYFLSKECRVYISEYNEKKEKDDSIIKELEKKGVKIEFGSHSDDFIKGSSFCILSPSIPPDSAIIAKLKEENIKYFSDIEFTSFNNNEKMVVITGTNGKTTTTALISHILSKKFNAPCCGNIGVSPLEYINDNPDYYVVEASSFQLYYSNSLKPKIAVFCNLTPDHILWHKTLDEYFESKAKPFYNLDSSDYAILNYDDNRLRALAQKTKGNVCFFSLSGLNQKNCAYVKNNKIFFENEEIVDINDLQIVGPHNLQNVMASIIAAKILKLDNSAIKEALITFKAIEHRLEFIRTIDKTDYYNDSKATNPEASVVAINSFKNKKVVLIAGGRDKKTTLAEFIKAIKERISKVVLIGEATNRFKNELFEQGYMNTVNSKTLEEAIDIASLDKPDVVLLSPACASFDMFESYEKRGEAFREYVLSKK